MSDRPLSKTQRRRFGELTDLMMSLANDTVHPDLLRGRLPMGWEDIRKEPDGDRLRVTLRVDRDVLKFFRSYGKGYQEIVAKVLRSYMLSRLCELLPEPGDDIEPVTEKQREQAKGEHQAMRYLQMMRSDRLPIRRPFRDPEEVEQELAERDRALAREADREARERRELQKEALGDKPLWVVERQERKKAAMKRLRAEVGKRLRGEF
ncbi:BrnA antitoxin family protein [Histidinibacterium lentulum]|uniref:BrnA antitoxin family protein n=1 Tax=Histidinibacterium lentulum TaxID=2480588 RepID=UPI001C857C7A|nr:BrnA antitoxin family protein [Histidinibacterium lentulum]